MMDAGSCDKGLPSSRHRTQQHRVPPHSPILRAGITYFLLVFAAGFIFGSIRVPFVVPLIGARRAELIEMPIMLYVIVRSSKHVVQRFSAGTSLWVGAVGLVLMVFAELSTAFIISGSVVGMLEKSLWKRDPVSGSVYLVMLGIYAVMPMLHKKMEKDSRGLEDPKVARSDCMQSPVALSVFLAR